jgi:ribonuclease HII
MLKSRHTKDEKIEAGIDEAGRGCLWGPLMAAAVIWPEESSWTDEIRSISSSIKDSKQLSAKKRSILESQIKTHAIAWSLGSVEAKEIDTIGMTKSNRLAFERALQALGRPVDRVLIDGILGITQRDTLEQIIEPKGDGTYLSIAAASILAKEGRDRIVNEICGQSPELNEKYHLLTSKGYGTLKHREGIKTHGLHEFHRRLFLRKLLGLNHTISEEYEFIEC